MVTKVIGKANNFDIIFTRATEDVWKADVPATQWGEYVIELWAHDNAGNISYLSKMLYLVSKHTMEAILVPFDFAVTLTPKEYEAYIIKGEYQAMLTSEKYNNYLATHSV